MAKIPTATGQGRQAGRGGGQFIQQGGVQVPRGSDIDVGLDEALASIQRMVVMTGQANNEQKENEAVTKIRGLSAEVSQEALKLDPTEQLKFYEDTMKERMPALREEFGYNSVVWGGAETRTEDFLVSQGTSLAASAAKTQSELSKASLASLSQSSVMDVASTMSNPHFDHSNISVLASNYTYIGNLANDIMVAHLKSVGTGVYVSQDEARVEANKQIATLYESAIRMQVEKDTVASEAVVNSLLNNSDIASILEVNGSRDDLVKLHAGQKQRIEEQGKIAMQINLQSMIDDIDKVSPEDLGNAYSSIRGGAAQTGASLKETQDYMEDAFKNSTLAQNFTSEQQVDDWIALHRENDTFRGMDIDYDTVKSSYITNAESEAKERVEELSGVFLRLHANGVPFDPEYVELSEKTLAENFMVEGEQVTALLTPYIDTLTANLKDRRNQAALQTVLDYVQNTRKIDNETFSNARKLLIKSIPELDKSEARVNEYLAGQRDQLLPGDKDTLNTLVKDNIEEWINSELIYDLAKTNGVILNVQKEHINGFYETGDYRGLDKVLEKYGTVSASEITGLNRKFTVDSSQEMVYDYLMYTDESVKGAFIEFLGKNPQGESMVFSTRKMVVNLMNGDMTQAQINAGLATEWDARRAALNNVLYGSTNDSSVYNPEEIQEYATSIAWRGLDAISPGGVVGQGVGALNDEQFLQAFDAGLASFAEDIARTRTMLRTHGGFSTAMIKNNLNNLQFVALIEDLSVAYPIKPKKSFASAAAFHNIWRPIELSEPVTQVVGQSMIETSINKLESISRKEISADTNHAFFSEPSEQGLAVGVEKELVIPFRTSDQEVGFVVMEFMNDGTMRPMSVGGIQDGIVSTAYAQRVVGEDETFVASRQAHYATMVQIDSRLSNTRIRPGFDVNDAVTLAIEHWSSMNDDAEPTEDDLDAVMEIYNQLTQQGQNP